MFKKKKKLSSLKGFVGITGVDQIIPNSKIKCDGVNQRTLDTDTDT